MYFAFQAGKQCKIKLKNARLVCLRKRWYNWIKVLQKVQINSIIHPKENAQFIIYNLLKSFVFEFFEQFFLNLANEYAYTVSL